MPSLLPPSLHLPHARPRSRQLAPLLKAQRLLVFDHGKEKVMPEVDAAPDEVSCFFISGGTEKKARMCGTLEVWG